MGRSSTPTRLSARTESSANRRRRHDRRDDSRRGRRQRAAVSGPCRPFTRLSLQEDRLTQLTEDHSWVTRQVRTGLLTPEEAVDHPRQNFITRALGIRETVTVDCIERDTDPGDVLLLCSDGLYRQLRRRNASPHRCDALARTPRPSVDEARQRRRQRTTSPPLRDWRRRADPDVPTIERVALLGRLSRELARSLDLNETLQSVLRQLLQVSGGERAAILLRVPTTPSPHSIVTTWIRSSNMFSHTVAVEAMRESRAILVANALDDPRFSRVESIVDWRSARSSASPMIVKKRPSASSMSTRPRPTCASPGRSRSARLVRQPRRNRDPERETA